VLSVSLKRKSELRIPLTPTKRQLRSVTVLLQTPHIRNTESIAMQRMLKASDIRQRYGVSDMTLHRWIKTKSFPVPMTVNQRRFWEPEEIEAWERAHRQSEGQHEAA
jgi:predicted DNA-binding transcriptional regulator AlpA